MKCYNCMYNLGMLQPLSFMGPSWIPFSSGITAHAYLKNILGYNNSMPTSE